MIQKYSLICFAFFAIISAGFAQVNIIPVRTDVAGFATWTDASVAGTTYVQLLTATSSTISPAMDFTAYTTETLNFTARTFGGVNATENTVTVSISTNNGGTWTPLGTRTPTNTTLTAMAPFDLSSYTGTQVRIRFTVAGTSNTVGIGIDDITITGVVASADTSIEFASPTYTVNENGSSINVCVNIDSPSATNATTADVVLVSSNNPHLTFTSTSITFPAGSSAQQCVSVPILDNSICADSNTYTFELQNVSGGVSAAVGTEDSTVLTVNDNEGTSGAFRTLSFETGDDWGYTGGGTVNSTANKFYGTASYRLGTGTVNLTTDNIDISSYTNVTLSVTFASLGADSGEDLFLDISYDNGATWTGTGSIKLVDGFSNANIDIGTTNAVDPTTVGTNPWTVTIPVTETQVMVRLRSVALDAGEYYFVDDIILRGESCPTCTPTHTVSSFSPTSGPIGTYVTIQGSGFTAGTSVTFNDGIAANIISQNATQLVVEVPVGTETGAIIVEENGCTIDTSDFTLITTSGSCGGLDDLIMTEIYDKVSGSLGYIEIYNGTGNAINLSNYSIRRYGDASDLSAGEYTLYTFPSSTPSIANNAVLFGNVFSPGNTDSDAAHNFTYVVDCSNTGGNWSCGGFNDEDIFHLYNGTTLVDVYIVPNTNVGYVARRNTNTTGPNNVSTPGDWSHTNTENTSNLGIFSFTGTPSGFPNVTTSPSDVSCVSDAVFTAIATPGNSGTLTYQWYFNNGLSASWTLVTALNLPLATVSGQNTNQLTLSGNYLNYIGYQFYCLVTENASCTRASDAAQLNPPRTIWNAGSWSNGLPNINTVAIIDANYNTNAGGQQTSFSACNLLVRAGTLTIADNTYVEVENNVAVTSNIIVNERGSFKQNNNNGDVIVTGSVLVRKETAPMNNWYEYTYWSSPVAGETIENALADASPDRRFRFVAQNYLDSTAETGNNNATVAGQDDIDDSAPWDWMPATGTMLSGVGYASTHRSNLFNQLPCNGGSNCRFVYTFDGPFNNGIYNVPLYRNDAELNDNNWNFIGNPYPSAIWANAFLTANTLLDTNVPTPGFIDGAIYLWSQNTAPADDANGNEALNFAQADYAIINGTAQSAGGDGVMPTRYIPSGQGFFVSLSDAAATTVVSGTIRTANVVFNNQMRVTGNNNQFFRTSEESQPNKLWVNLTSDNGVFNQIVIGYVDGATDAYDGMYYDAPRNLSTDANSILYTIVPDSNKKLAIQGKEPNSLTLDEVIPLGFYTSINQATIYKLSIAQFEGDFFTNQTVYVKDNLLNLYHDLSAADYPFTSEIGEFNERFEIVFQTQTLGIGDVDLHPNDISIIELNNGHVKFTVGHNLTIQSVEIYDMLGRQLYNLPGSNTIEIYNLANLSQAAYVAKVTLSNGQTVTKRAVKRL